MTAAGYNYTVVQAIVNRKMAARRAVYYTIRRGDTLSAIAARYGTTYQKLAASVTNTVHLGLFIKHVVGICTL